MDLKRKIYLLTNFLILISFFILPLSTSIPYIAAFFLLLICFCIPTVVIAVITDGNILIPPSGLLTLKYKKIYYNNLTFYIFVKKSITIIYKQEYFYTIFIDNVNNTEDLEVYKNDIKDILERDFKKEIKKGKERKEEKEKINKIKKWDGFLDKQSRRDNKITKIIKQ
jgi:hypothetical protein